MAISIAANRFRLIKQSAAIDGKIHTPDTETKSICNRQTIARNSQNVVALFYYRWVGLFLSWNLCAVAN